MPQYLRNPPLDTTSMLAEPLDQLAEWLTVAQRAGLFDHTAMTLATVGADGQPAARIVLFKGFYDGGLTFYTNYHSRKGTDLAHDPRAALVFWWDVLERQVRIEGSVTPLPRAVSEAYFHSRPRLSQLGALVSRQSEVVATREELDQRMSALEQQYEGLEIPCPENWGGYCVMPQAMEFWQGRQGRLHDRLRYRRQAQGWVIERLEP